jgi:hypothetical protein
LDHRDEAGGQPFYWNQYPSRLFEALSLLKNLEPFAEPWLFYISNKISNEPQTLVGF